MDALEDAAASVPPPPAWAKPQPKTKPASTKPTAEQAKQARQDEADHRKRVAALRHAGIDVPAGPADDEFQDARDPQYRADVQQLFRQHRDMLQAAGKPKAKPQPTPTARTPEELLTTANQAVRDFHTPAMRDMLATGIAAKLVNQAIKEAGGTPIKSQKALKQQPGYATAMKRAQQQAHDYLDRKAREAIGAAEQGGADAAEIRSLRDAHAGAAKLRPRETGFESVQPVIRTAGGEAVPMTEESLARQEQKKTGQPSTPPAPKERQKTKAQVAAEHNQAMANEYGWTPKRYADEASDFWNNEEDQQRTEAKRRAWDDVKGGRMANQLAALENAGQDQDKMKEFDEVARDIAHQHTDLGWDEDNAYEQLQDLLTSPKPEPLGPHDEEWHKRFADHLRQRGIVPFSERQAASQNEPEAEQVPSQEAEPEHGFSQDEMDEMKQEAFETGRPLEEIMDARRESLEGSTPFHARGHRDLRQELYSALWWASVAKA